ncbi:MAG: bifunctional ornithine acetyltransferase/N-acetylglutamate synthase, partial [bacterium]
VRNSNRKPQITAFENALKHVCQKLAIELVRDGEGATKLIEVIAEGTQTDRDAKLAARAIAVSPLVKTAMFGEDPNWGRILSAAGASGADFNPEKAAVILNGRPVYKNGKVCNPHAKLLKGNTILIHTILGAGNGFARVWTCDFSYEYIKINAEYTT